MAAGMRALSFFGSKIMTTNKKASNKTTTTKQTDIQSSSSCEHEQSRTDNSSSRRNRTTTTTATATTRRSRSRGGGVVSFAELVEVQPTISIGDYTSDEIYNTWYMKIEYQEIRRSCAKQVCKLESGEKLLDQKYCSRGLEKLTKVAQQAKLRTRYESITAVLDRQEYVSNLTLQDIGCQEEYKQLVDNYEEDISNVYRRITSSCQLWATTVGLADAKEVESSDLDDVLLEDFNNVDDVDVAAEVEQQGYAPPSKKDGNAGLSSSSSSSKMITFSTTTTTTTTTNLKTMEASASSTSSSRCIPAPTMRVPDFYHPTPEMARSA